ncbi:DHH family phosphoesterase [Breznakiella homolactica]|uniref:Bifunctional oligoribonuclease/PAP phosphatase NrnA n=1 Tax=Breznakiella homolactica TaxID=2798577 RepID=A0A7T8B8M9_9SPIR|nr:bifunctional oligoribonuclease/PAP phosphatase NrnA [Breznakiella homolactica]QQO07547.1 bifunctional oligoribonuclease/PAP phosphatase NrnA [Breznakiella homolactica]
MMQKALDFIKKYKSFILTTHDNPDADGLGAEILLKDVLEKIGKQAVIVNPAPAPERFKFMIPKKSMFAWDESKRKQLPEKAVMIILDTSDEFNIGKISDEVLPFVEKVLIIDHHELNPLSSLDGYVDSTASSTCEMVAEIAEKFKVTIEKSSAVAAFTGIVYDTGSFAYAKTSARTFKAAILLAEAGAVPNIIYEKLYESSSTGALLLQQRVLSTLELLTDGQVAVQILRKEDLTITGATVDDAESFINIPLKSRDIKVSILIKENHQGPVRCSLRSKGSVNVSKIAQFFNGGGHARAAGFRSDVGIEETLNNVMQKINAALGKT